MHKISDKLPQRSGNGEKSEKFGMGCPDLSDLSRTCPAPVPDLSRTCPGPVPDLSRTCPAPVPDLSRTCPGLSRTVSFAEPTPLLAFYCPNVENTLFGGSSDVLEGSQAFMATLAGRWLLTGHDSGTQPWSPRFKRFQTFATYLFPFHQVSFAFGCDIALVDIVLGCPQSLMASAFFVQNWISSCWKRVFGGQNFGTTYETSFTSRSEILEGICGQLKMGMRLRMAANDSKQCAVPIF